MPSDTNGPHIFKDEQFFRVLILGGTTRDRMQAQLVPRELNVTFTSGSLLVEFFMRNSVMYER